MVSLGASVSLMTAAMGGLLALTRFMKVDDIANFAGTIAILTIVMGALGAALVVGVNNLSNADALLPLVSSVSLALGALTVCCFIASKIPAKAAIEGAVGLSAFVAILSGVFLAVGALIYGIDELFGDNSSFESMERAVEALGFLGEGIGKLITGVMKGFGEGITAALPQIGTDLSNFIINLSPFIEKLKGYKSESLDGAETIVEILLMFAAAKFINGLSRLTNFGSSFKAKDVKNMFTAIGEGYAAFAKSVEGVASTDVVNQAANSAETLTELANKMPKENGILQKWFGQFSGWDKFSEGLSAFGEAYKAYANSVSEITNFDTVEVSANAAGSLATLANSLPSTGGKLQEWFGEKTTLSEFSEGLVAFGVVLKGYSDAVQGIDTDLVEKTASAAGALATLANSLPSTGGKLQEWFGEKTTLSEFADQIISFAVKLVNYSQALNGLDIGVAEKSTAAVEAIKALSELSTAIVGNIQLGGLGSDLVDFGAKFKNYTLNVAGSDFGAFNTVISALESLQRFTGSLSGSSDDGLGLLSLGASLRSLGNTGIEEFIRTFTDAESKLNQAGENIVTYLVSGMLLRFAASEVLIQNRSSRIGEIMASSIINSINGSLSIISSKSQDLATVLIDELDSGLDIQGGVSVKMKNRGETAVRSYATGIEGGAYMAVDAAAGVSHGVLAASEEVIETENKTGQLLDETTVEGIKEKAQDVYETGTDMIGDVVDGMMEKVDEGMSKLPKTFQDKFGKAIDSLKVVGERGLAKATGEFTDYWSELGGSGIFNISNDLSEASAVANDAVNEITGSYDDLASSSSKSKKKIVDIDNEILTEEEEFWRSLLRIKREGSEADKYNALSVKEFEEEVFEETIEIWKNYTDKLTSTADSVMNSHNLFEAVEKSEAKSKEDLFKNLDAQIEEYRNYAETLSVVSFKLGDDRGLTKYLKSLGVSSLEQLKVINNMTDEELSRYADLYDQKYAYATNIASQQITDFKEETEKELEDYFALAPGSIDLQTFAENFTGTFESLTGYINDIALPLSQSIIESMTAMQEASGDAIVGANGYITDAFDQTFDEVKQIYDQRAIEYGEETGEYLDQGIAKGIEDSTAAETAAASSIDDIQTAYETAAEIQSPSQRMADEVGLYLAEGVGLGMVSRIAKLYLLKKAIEVTSHIIESFNQQKEKFEQAGMDASMGFAQGFKNGIVDVINAAADVANASVDSTKEALDEHSPSKKFIEVGRNAILGLAKGMNELNTLPGEEMKKAADEGIKVAEYALDAVSNILENGADDEFTIRPVMDLTNIKSGTTQLSNMISRTKGLNVASTIEQNQKLRTQNESTGTNYTFNQYNTSPKALSDIEIYRHTKNQFAMLKGATS